MGEEFYRKVCELISERSPFPFEDVWNCYRRVKMLDVVITLVILAERCEVSLTEVSGRVKI